MLEEEERNKFYAAMTQARKSVTLLWSEHTIDMYNRRRENLPFDRSRSGQLSGGPRCPDCAHIRTKNRLIWGNHNARRSLISGFCDLKASQCSVYEFEPLPAHMLTSQTFP